MKLNKIAATAAMAGALGSAALGIGAGLAQADPNGPNVPGPGPNVPGPNVPGQNVPGPNGPGQGQGQVPGNVPGQPICNPSPGVNCHGPGSPLPPGQRDAPPPGHYNEPTRYGLPPTWTYNGQDLPVVYDPGHNAWGVNASDGFHVYTGPGAGVGGEAGGQVGIQPGT